MMGVRYIQAIKARAIPCTMSRTKTPREATSQAMPQVPINCGSNTTGRKTIDA
jgi:hypothetical protein